MHDDDDILSFSFPSERKKVENTFVETIRFGRLDNGSFAFIHSERRWVYFPEDFCPVLGRPYECSVYKTVTGVFIYRGDGYRVCRAHLLANVESASVDSYGAAVRPKDESPFATALKGFYAPPCVERHTVRAVRNPKSGNIGLVPVYKNKDADFFDQPTMYFLVTDTTLVEGKEYVVRVEKKLSTGRNNQRGALMVSVKVIVE